MVASITSSITSIHGRASKRNGWCGKIGKVVREREALNVAKRGVEEGLKF